MSTDVSKEHIASILMVEEYSEKETSVKTDDKQSWRRYVPLKIRLAFNGLLGVMPQKIVLFITTGVRTSVPT
jgi:hypothetical protein